MSTIGSIILSTLAKRSLEKIIDNFNAEKTSQELEKIIKRVSREFEKKFPDVFGGNIESFFCESKTFNIFFELLFIDEEIDINKFNEEIDQSTLPENFLSEYINAIKDQVLKSTLLSSIFRSKEIYNIVLQTQKDLKNIKSSLKGDDFIKKIDEYKRTLATQLETVHFFGLGINSSLQKTRRKITDLYVNPFFAEYWKMKEDGFTIRRRILQYRLWGNTFTGDDILKTIIS